MPNRLLVGSVVLYLLTGCASQQQVPEATAVPQCEFVINSEVDGVAVASSVGPRDVSVADETLQFTLSCGQQVFSLTKPCYAAQQIVLEPAPKKEHVLTREEWEHYGYLRVENDSSSAPLVVDGLPGSELSVDAHSHSPRKIPLGAHRVTLSAPFKVPVQYEFKVCRENEIFNLRVDTESHNGELVAQGSQKVSLQHGFGSLRVLTEEVGVSFTIEPELDHTLQELMQKLGADEFIQLSIEDVPEPIRKGFNLFQKLKNGSFRVPALLELPAGRYLLSHSLQTPGASPFVLRVAAGQEVQLSLQENNRAVTLE